MLQYRVWQNLLVDADAFDEVGSYVNEKSLVLITCENETIDGGYQDRRIIIADPV